MSQEVLTFSLLIARSHVKCVIFIADTHNENFYALVILRNSLFIYCHMNRVRDSHKCHTFPTSSWFYWRSGEKFVRLSDIFRILWTVQWQQMWTDCTVPHIPCNKYFFINFDRKIIKAFIDCHQLSVLWHFYYILWLKELFDIIYDCINSYESQCPRAICCLHCTAYEINKMLWLMKLLFIYMQNYRCRVNMRRK